jgi:hypothetical protein
MVRTVSISAICYAVILCSLQRRHHLLIHHLPEELPLAIDHRLFALILFQVLLHLVAVLLPLLIAQLTEVLLVLLIRTVIGILTPFQVLSQQLPLLLILLFAEHLFVFITVQITGLLTFLNQLLQDTHPGDIIDGTGVFW